MARGKKRKSGSTRRCRAKSGPNKGKFIKCKRRKAR